MTPLVKANSYVIRDDVIKVTAETMNCTLDEARDMLVKQAESESTWVNEKYQVITHTFEHPQLGPCMHINIRRRDGNVILRDWREFQQIKNQLAGPECEGLELYPAESRKVDQNNKYHLYVLLTPDEDHRIPFGWQERDVAEAVPGATRGIRQRPLPKSDPESRQHKK